MSDIQYIEQAQKGFTVSYGDRSYRIQDDGKGWLHIVVNKKKVDLKKIHLFDYGSEADWVFNQWYQIYPDYEQFRTFADNEKISI